MDFTSSENDMRSMAFNKAAHMVFVDEKNAIVRSHVMDGVCKQIAILAYHWLRCIRMWRAENPICVSLTHCAFTLSSTGTGVSVIFDSFWMQKHLSFVFWLRYLNPFAQNEMKNMKYSFEISWTERHARIILIRRYIFIWVQIKVTFSRM